MSFVEQFQIISRDDIEFMWALDVWGDVGRGTTAGARRGQGVGRPAAGSGEGYRTGGRGERGSLAEEAAGRAAGTGMKGTARGGGNIAAWRAIYHGVMQSAGREADDKMGFGCQ
jgi:hypothetical protein